MKLIIFSVLTSAPLSLGSRLSEESSQVGGVSLVTAPGCLALGGSLSRGSLAANRGSIMSTVSSLVGPAVNKQSSSTLASLAGLLSETTPTSLIRADRDGVSEGSGSSSKDRDWVNRVESFNSGRDAVSLRSGRDAFSILSSREASIYGPRDTASIQSIRDGSLHSSRDPSIHSSRDPSIHSSRDPSIHSTRDGSILSTRDGPVHISRDGSLLSACEASIHSGREFSVSNVREGSIHSDRDIPPLQNNTIHSTQLESAVYNIRDGSTMQSTAKDSILSGHDASLHSSRDNISQHSFRDSTRDLGALNSMSGTREISALSVRDGTIANNEARRSRTIMGITTRNNNSAASSVTFPNREVVPLGPLDPGWDASVGMISQDNIPSISSATSYQHSIPNNATSSSPYQHGATSLSYQQSIPNSNATSISYQHGIPNSSATSSYQPDSTYISSTYQYSQSSTGDCPPYQHGSTGTSTSHGYQHASSPTGYQLTSVNPPTSHGYHHGSVNTSSHGYHHSSANTPTSHGYQHCGVNTSTSHAYQHGDANSIPTSSHSYPHHHHHHHHKNQDLSNSSKQASHGHHIDEHCSRPHIQRVRVCYLSKHFQYYYH